MVGLGVGAGAVWGVRAVGAGCLGIHHDRQGPLFFVLSLPHRGSDMRTGGRIVRYSLDRRRPRRGSWRTGAGIALDRRAGSRALDRGPGSNSEQDRGRWVWVLIRALGVIQGAGLALVVDSWSTWWTVGRWIFSGCLAGGLVSLRVDYCYYCFAFAFAKFPAFPLGTHSVISTR